MRQRLLALAMGLGGACSFTSPAGPGTGLAKRAPAAASVAAATVATATVATAEPTSPTDPGAFRVSSADGALLATHEAGTVSLFERATSKSTRTAAPPLYRMGFLAEGRGLVGELQEGDRHGVWLVAVPDLTLRMRELGDIVSVDPNAERAAVTTISPGTTSTAAIEVAFFDLASGRSIARTRTESLSPFVTGVAFSNGGERAAWINAPAVGVNERAVAHVLDLMTGAEVVQERDGVGGADLPPPRFAADGTLCLSERWVMPARPRGTITEVCVFEDEDQPQTTYSRRTAFVLRLPTPPGFEVPTSFAAIGRSQVSMAH